MLGSIYIGLSGLDAFSRGLRTISNNVANLNSPGFKASTLSFTGVFNSGGLGSGYTGGTTAHREGAGVRFTGERIDFGQGDLRQTSSDLDLAIEGNGFFVLLDGERTYYARTGQFEVNSDGFVTQIGTGYRLGVLDGQHQASGVNVDAKRTSQPVATTKIVLADNLSSTGTTATVSNIVVFDSRGGRHVWQARFDAVSGSPGEWTVTVSEGATEVGKSTLKFLGSSPDPATAKFDVSASPAGADPLKVQFDLAGITSFSSGTTSLVRTASVDGNAVGALVSVSVDADGQVKLLYSNQKTELLGAVALADFRDPQSLTAVANGLFENEGTGQPRLLGSGNDGIGKVLSRQLEGSNVDLSQQFGDLILVQRGFQASSQVVSVSNDMIQQLFGMRGQG